MRKQFTRSFILLLLLFPCLFPFAQTFPFRSQNGLYGLKDATGNEVIPAEYDKIEYTSYAKTHYYLYRSNKIRITDTKGSLLPGTYDRITRIQDRSGLISDKGKYWHLTESEGYQGLMTLNYVEVIPPRYSSIDIQFEGKGLAYVSYKGRHGIVNTKGEEIIKPQYDRRLYFNQDGISAASINGRHGYIDKQGKIIIPFEYEAAGIFSEGLASVKSKGKYGFIDRNNKWVVSNKYEETGMFFDGLCPVKKKGKWGYINLKGKTVISHKFRYAGPFVLGKAIVTDFDGVDYYMDTKGKLTKR